MVVTVCKNCFHMDQSGKSWSPMGCVPMLYVPPGDCGSFMGENKIYNIKYTAEVVHFCGTECPEK